MARSRSRDTAQIIAGDSTRQFAQSGGGLPSLDVTHFGQSPIWKMDSWEYETITAKALKWDPTVDYYRHEVVEYEGQLFVNTNTGVTSKGYEPAVNSHHWRQLSTTVKIWEPSHDWKRGDIVLVPWHEPWLTIDNSTWPQIELAGFTVWRCNTDQPGNIPVDPIVGVSPADVPPGQYWKQNIHDPSDPGHVMLNNGNWEAITAGRTLLVDNRSTLAMQAEPVVPGSIAITMDNGYIYKYTAKPRSPTFNTTRPDAICTDGWEWQGKLYLGDHQVKTKVYGWDQAKDYQSLEVVKHNELYYSATADIPAGVEPGLNPVQKRIAKGASLGQIGTTTGTFRIDNLPMTTGTEHTGTYYELIQGSASYVPQGGPFHGETLTGNLEVVAIGSIGGQTVGSHGGWMLFPADPNRAYYSVDDPTYTHNPWREFPYITSKLLNDSIAPLVAGIVHGAAVNAIAKDPPAAPADGDLYIVAASPTGAFVGHTNKIALYQAGSWTFSDPGKDEAHLNEGDNSIYHWSGTAWNKIGSLGVSKLDDLADVDLKTTAPTSGQSLVYNGSSWIPSTPGQPAQVLSSKFQTGDLNSEMFHNVTVKTKVGYVYVMDFGGTFHASHENSIGYYMFNIDGGERAKYKVAGGRGYAQGGSYKYFVDGTGNDVNFAFVNSWTDSVTWEFCWCMLTEIYRKP